MTELHLDAIAAFHRELRNHPVHGDDAYQAAIRAYLAAAPVEPVAIHAQICDFVCDVVLPSYDIDSDVGRQDPELHDAIRASFSAAPTTSEPVAVPEGITFRPSPIGLHNFYDMDENGMGQAFYEKWKSRAVEFPLFNTPPAAPTAIDVAIEDTLVEQLAEIAQKHLEIDYDGDDAFIRNDSLDSAIRAILASSRPRGRLHDG